MLHSWGPVVKLRSAARALGVARALARFRNSTAYEARFGTAMLGALRPGDTVWDVGANVGFYTEKFAAAVGEAGRVVAFEPVPSCYRELAGNLAGRSNVRLVNAGLGRTSGTVAFDVGDGDATLGRVADASGPPSDGAKLLHLPIYAGDEAVKAEGLPAPSFVKIDVEGHELDTLAGMASLLRSPACRNVFVEVHFGLLERRGLAPKQVVAQLHDLGFKVRWVDASHVHAFRPGAG